MSISFFITKNERLSRETELSPNCWIDVLEPTPEDSSWLSDELGIVPEFLTSAYDDEETSHVDVDEDTGQVLVTIDCPFAEDEDEKDDKNVRQYDTHPLTFVFVPDKKVVVTFSIRCNPAIESVIRGNGKGVDTSHRTKFLLQVLLKVARNYLVCLRSINRQIREYEKALRANMSNQDLIKMLGLEKSLVYFSTSLQGLESTVNRIKVGRTLDFYEDDKELLDDVLIEVQQATEMCTIYTNILNGITDTFASVINNNLNSTMRILTTITLILAIPTIVFSFYGMNVDGLPFIEWCWPPVVISAVLVAIVIGILKVTKLLK